MASSILIIRYSALGDTVLATSVLEPLRAAHPGAHVAWVVDRAHEPLLRGTADELISFSRKDAASRAAVLRAVQGRFELAIDLQNKLWSRRLARAAAPERRAFVRRTPWQALRSLVGHDVVLDDTHATTLYARAAGLDRPGRPFLVARAPSPLPPGRWVALAPGATWETKRWAPERFAAVGRALKARGLKLALVGGPMDAPVLDAVRAQVEVDADLREAPLEVLAAALAEVECFLGNDSGLAHVTTALGRPAIALFGPTSVVRWGPVAPGKAVSLGLACAPCSNHGTHRCPLGHHRCMTELSVEQVLAALP